MSKLYIYLLFMFIVPNVFGQRGGYLNKMHELSFDVYSPIILGEYGLNYKLSAFKNVALYAKFRAISKNGDIIVGKRLENQATSLINVSGYGLLDVGNYKVSGILWAIGLIFSNSNAGMHLPLGYYNGIQFEKFKCDFSETIKAENKKKYKYEHKGWKFLILWGKNTYITHNIVIDFVIEYGARFSTVSYRKDINDPSRRPLGYYPYRSRILNVEWETHNTYMSKNVYRYFDLIFSPQLKIGYLF